MSAPLRILKNTAYQIVGQFLHILLNVGLVAMLARYLGVEEYGKYSIIFVIISFFLILTDFGINDIVVRELSKDRSKAAPMVYDLFLIKLFMGLAACALSIGVVWMLNYEADMRRLFTWAAITLLLSSMSSVGTIIFRLNLWMERFVIAALVRDAVLLLSVWVVIVMKGGMLYLIWGVLLANAMDLGIVLLLMRDVLDKPTFGLNTRLWRSIFRSALPLGLALVIVNLYMSIDILLLEKLAGKEAVGYYSASYKFVFQAIFLPVAFVNLLFPFMSEYWNTDRNKLKILFQKACDYAGLIAIPLGMIVTVIAPKLIVLVFGKDYAPSIPSLQILIWAVVLMFQSVILGSMMIALDQQRKSLVINVLGLAVNIGLNLILIPIIGFIGAAITTVVTEVVVLAPTIYIVQRKLSYRLSLNSFLKSFLLGLVCALLLLVSQQLNLIFQMSICAAGYAGTVFLFRLIPREDLELLLQGMQRNPAV